MQSLEAQPDQGNPDQATEELVLINEEPAADIPEDQSVSGQPMQESEENAAADELTEARPVAEQPSTDADHALADAGASVADITVNEEQPQEGSQGEAQEMQQGLGAQTDSLAVPEMVPLEQTEPISENVISQSMQAQQMQAASAAELPMQPLGESADDATGRPAMVHDADQ